jgi:hypothetical protein
VVSLFGTTVGKAYTIPTLIAIFRREMSQITPVLATWIIRSKTSVSFLVLSRTSPTYDT